MESESLLRPPASASRLGELEKLVRESEEKHARVLTKFSHATEWWRIEWFVAEVFHAKGWLVIGQPALAAKRLQWALDERLRTMEPGGKMSDVEAGNLSWWSRTALKAIFGFEPAQRDLLERLAAEIYSEAPRDRIHAAGQALLKSQRAPWERA